MRRGLALAAAAALAAQGCAGARAAGPGLTEREQALVQLKRKDVQGALPRLERLLAAAPQDLELARAVAEAWALTGAPEPLLQRLAPQDTPVAHYMRGLVLFARAADASGPAIAAFERARTLAPKEAEFHYRLGLALVESERDEEALAPLRQALALAPARASWNLPLAKALHRTGDAKGAVAALGRFLEGRPEPREVQTAQALMGQIADPFAGFPQAARPRVEQALNWLQVVDVPQQAIAELESVLRDYPDLPVVHALLGLAYQRLDDAGRAVEEFKRAIELAPEDGKNHLYLAQLYLARQRSAAAKEHLEKAVERNPLLFEAWFALGDLAVERRDLPVAARCFQTTTLLDPASVPARGKLALVYQLEGDWPAAERELKVVLAQDENNPEFLLRLGVLHTERFRRARAPQEKREAAQQAESWLRKVLQLQPDNAIASAALEAVQRR